MRLSGRENESERRREIKDEEREGDCERKNIRLFSLAQFPSASSAVVR